MSPALIVFLIGCSFLVLLFWFFASEVEKRKRNIGTVLITGIITICLIALNPPSFQKHLDASDDESEMVSTLKPGIDIAGGSAFTLEVQPKIDDKGETVPVTANAVAEAIKTLRSRLDPEGTKDLLIQAQGTNRISIQMPGITEEEANQVESMILETAKLELKAVHPNNSVLAQEVEAGIKGKPPGYTLYSYTSTRDGETRTEPLLLSRRVKVKGSHVRFAGPDYAQPGVVQVRLKSEGGDAMRDLTSKMTLGRDRLAVVLDGEVMSAPVVQAILGSQFVIEGLDSIEEAQTLSASLMNPLENSVKILQKREVTARHGEATIKQGINAGIAGLALTMVFVLIYYRFAGIIALLGLSVNVIILFGVMAMFGFTFTLPGIAGIILTIGVAVDANVLIYERLREELKGGKSLANAIRTAYEKAFSAIFDANITTLITAIILFWRASGTVKGFAVTLTIGILASMFAALVATRVFFWWATDTGVAKKLSFWNLIPENAINFMGQRKRSLTLSLVVLVAALGIMGAKQSSMLGIDFVGGSQITFQVGDADIPASVVDNALSDLTLEKAHIATAESIPGTGELLSISCATADIDKIIDELRKDIPALAEIEADQTVVGPTLGKEFLLNSIAALGLGLVAILLYITIRFEFSFAVGAFAALVHDMIICLGIIIATGTELSLIHVGAVLTILGYSINDTIVVFDRIREMLQIKSGKVVDIMNFAINSTLSRTLLTSVTTFVAVLVLYIYGGPNLKDFSFAIMIGVVVGTYSSIFVASPVVLIWSEKRGSNLRHELLEANVETQVSTAES